MFDKKRFMWIAFGMLVFFNLSRFIGWRYFSETILWKTIVYDNLHHYQFGLVLLVIAIFVKKMRTLTLALGVGMVIDESMYLFYSLDSNFRHGTWQGVFFEFSLLSMLGLLLLRRSKMAVGDRI